MNFSLAINQQSNFIPIMKIRSLFRNVLKIGVYFLLFLCMSFSVLGQCPTIPDSSPPAICDASGFTFNDLNAYAVDGGDGIRWHKVATGGSPFNANQLVSEGTYYADNSSGSCITRESIIVDFQVNRSGQSLDGIYCSNENATIQTYMDEVLQPNVPIGGSVKVYTNNILTNLANPTDPIPVGATNYFIVFVDNGGCESQVEGGSTAVFTAPADPTPTNPQAYCSDTNPTVADLNPGTTGNYNWYENIDGSGDPVLPALDLTTSLVDGNTYYIQVNDFFCDSNPVAVNVSISVPFNPGASSSLEYCNDNISPAVFNLFDELGGLKDTNGTWTGPLATTNGHQGTVDISTLTTAGIYTFTYMVPSNGACPEASASVVITIYETLSSGSTSLTVNPATYCEKDLPTAFDLFNLLDGTEDLGGQWTDGSNSIVSNPIDLSGLAAGVTYNFTYTQNALPSPCPEQSTTVQVTVLPDPNAGIAIYQTFCENDLASNSPFDLFNALSGQDNNSGTWTDASNATVSNSVDITGFTVTGSPYQFTYTISKGTCEDMETISITIEPAPESGTPIATFPEFCEGSAPASYDLFDLLTGEDQTGTWYIGPDNTGSTTPNPIDLSVLAIGTYDFTFDVNNIGSCDDVLVTVSVTINLLPNTGIPLPTVFCENDLVANSPLNLLDRLSGEDAGGTWADDDTTGALSGNTIDLNILTIGAYDFTYSITDANGCSNSSTVTVQVDDAPESGTATAPLSFCISEITSAQTVDLFDLLTDEDQTGTWNDDDASGALSGNILTIDGLSANTYNFTYGVNTIGSCDDDLVTVQVIINPLPNTGTPLPTVFCENDLAANAPLDLFDRLSGEDAGGTWADDDTTGALSGNNVDLTLLTIGNYSFTYSITDANGCSNSSTVTVQVNNAPESGIAIEPLEFCLSEITVAQTVNLFDLLTDEDQAGIWNDNNASGALSGNTVTIDGLSAGTYNFTFDVNAIGSCDDVNVMVTIIINDTPAPIASAIQEFCDAATVADLSATGTTIKWYDDATGGAALESTITLADGETYYATQMDATTGCESSVRTAVTVNIYQSPNAGDPSSTPIVACNNSTIDLSLGLDGTQDSGGTWYEGSDNTGTLIIDPTIYDVTGLGANNYQFTYYVIASAPCVDDSTTITVTIQEPLSAGANINPTLDICSNNGTTDLFGLLGGADTGGTWSPALASTSGIFDPLVDVQGTYTYMLSNACGSVSNSVIVNVTQAPNAGTDNSVTICVIDGTTDLFALLGTAQTGGTWSPLLNSGTGVFDPLFDTAGVYIYTITATAPCNPDSTAEIIVTVSDSNPPTVLNLNPEYCLVDNPKVSDLNTSISATDTVTWYADAALTTTLNAADALIDGEDYYATQTNTSGCESSANVQINVTVNDTPTPSLDDASIEYCINDAPSIQTLSENLVEYVQADDNIVWYNAATGGSAISNSSALTSMTYYAALVDAVTGCESSIRLEITPNLTACGLVQLPDGFLPNGDGTNDTYDYDNLDVLYPKFEIEIYNRYGSMVYKGNASTPRFNGKSNQGRTLGSGDLPVGMYYYIFNYNDGVNNPKQGNLYLSR
tara:strand:- start:3379 stop:8118 length:4740 start_codon:yes stop_codon:yes gene_type:complete